MFKVYMSMHSDPENADHEDISSSLPNVSRSIDQLTLELLTNKTQYEKYLSKSEPQKWSEKQTFLVNCEKYYSQMMKITSQYLKDPDLQLNVDVNNAFLNYAQCMIRHLEIKELGNYAAEQNDSDDDILFPENCIDPDDHLDYDSFEEFSRDTKPKQSKMEYLSRDFFRLSKNKHL
jgi:hypothetical protein